MSTVNDNFPHYDEKRYYPVLLVIYTKYSFLLVYDSEIERMKPDALGISFNFVSF